MVTLASTLYRSGAAVLQVSGSEPDLSTITSAERGMIETACRVDRNFNGPAAYYNCLRRQLAALQDGSGEPDLSIISGTERGMIETACRVDRNFNGPAAYYNCLSRQLAALPRDHSSKSVVKNQENDSIRTSEVQEGIENAIASVLKEDEVEFCQDTQDPNCRTAFLKSIHYRPVILSPSGQKGVIVELSAQGYCGSGGCAIYVLNETGSGYVKVLEELGSLDGFQVATSTNNGYYDLIRVGKLTASSYRWTGAEYVSNTSTDSVSDITHRPAASPSQPKLSPSDGEVTLWLAGLLVAGAFAGILYKIATKKKCIGCGKSARITGLYCAACSAIMEESARRASEQRASEQRARAEEQRVRAEEQRRAHEQKEEDERRRVSTLAELQLLTGLQFEELIASLFRKDGYTVRHCGGTGDEGIDLVLVMGQEKDVVQCKRWKNGIGSPILREFYGALMHAGARHGFIITTASFSQSARDFARGKPISLISGAEILRWVMGKYSSRDQGTSRPNVNKGSNAFDPYAVLGIARNASAEEIRAAYRREMVNYHPDKVAHLGKELQELAKVKAQEINEAYKELTRAR